MKCKVVVELQFDTRDFDEAVLKKAADGDLEAVRLTRQWIYGQIVAGMKDKQESILKSCLDAFKQYVEKIQFREAHRPDGRQTY